MIMYLITKCLRYDENLPAYQCEFKIKLGLAKMEIQIVHLTWFNNIK